jgi:hypothetical protein
MPCYFSVFFPWIGRATHFSHAFHPLNQGDYSFRPRSRIGCTCSHPCCYCLDQFLEKCGVRIGIQGDRWCHWRWPVFWSLATQCFSRRHFCHTLLNLPESPLSKWADATNWWEAVPINGSLLVSSPESESYSLPCTGDGTALAACRVRAILQHFFSKITLVFQSLKLQPNALIPTVTTPIFLLVYPLIFPPIKGRWSKFFFLKFRQSLLYTRRSQVIDNVPCTHLESHLIHNHIHV